MEGSIRRGGNCRSRFCEWKERLCSRQSRLARKGCGGLIWNGMWSQTSIWSRGKPQTARSHNPQQQTVSRQRRPRPSLAPLHTNQGSSHFTSHGFSHGVGLIRTFSRCNGGLKVGKEAAGGEE